MTTPRFHATPPEAVDETGREAVFIDDHTFHVERPIDSDKLFDHPWVRSAYAADEHAAGLEALLTLLADVPADVVRRGGAEPPTGFEQVAVVSLRGLDGADLGSFTLGVAPLDAGASQPEAAAVVFDRVAMRFYRAARSRDAIAWLAQHRPD